MFYKVCITTNVHFYTLNLGIIIYYVWILTLKCNVNAEFIVVAKSLHGTDVKSFLAVYLHAVAPSSSSLKDGV